MENKAKQVSIIIIAVIILLSCFNVNAIDTAKADQTDISSLPYSQEIVIPFDTSNELAKFQPIDMKINFEKSCWAIDKSQHAVRVFYDDSGNLIELESQIYDLEKIDDEHIKSCSLVFLIPEEADGTEKYYVYYSSSSTDSPDYEEHLSLEDAHYYYEPISGQKIEIDYYKITEDDFINYGVVQKGELLGNPIANSIVKFKPYTTIVETYNIDQLGTFDMRYGIEEEPGYIGSAWATEVNKQILVNGNLMIRLKIESIAPRGDIKTDNIYTYYYCPGEIKRITVDVNHEVLKTHEIEDPAIYDGTYAGIVSIKARSATIEKMNVGEILPLISLYSTEDTVKEYPVPLNPDSLEEEEIFSTSSDIDLGEKAWICLRNPDTHRTHGIIMESSTGIVDGVEDGVQVKAFVKQNIKLPGLEGDTGNLFLMKNSYDIGREHNTVLEEGFEVFLKMELVTIENDGYEKIDAESEIYQSLVKNVPIKREGIVEEEEEEVEKFNLKTRVHMALSVPMGSLLCAALGKNIPYIYAELYKDNSFQSSGSVNRIALAQIDLDLEDKNILQLLKMAVGMFDWGNISLFKKINFPGLEAGDYLVKIYKENPGFAKDSQYIGFGTINLSKDETIDITCRPQGNIKLTATDQNDCGIKDVKYLLVSEDTIISEAKSDSNGSCTITAPVFPLKPYKLQSIYQGFLVDEKEVRLTLKNRFIEMKETLSLDAYKLTLGLKDSWGFAPAVDLNPIITSNDMVESVSITAEKTNEGIYEFYSLYPAKYTLNMKYKAFEISEEIAINENKKVDLKFPAEYKIDFDVMDSYTNPVNDGKIVFTRNKESRQTKINSDGKASYFVPPGDYEITVIYDDKEIAKQKIDVRGDKKIDVVSSKDSFVHSLVFYFGLILCLFSIFYFILFKKKTITGLKFFVIGLILISIISPWWVVAGTNDIVETSTKTLLIPSEIVTTTSTTNVIGGDVSNVPEEVPMVLKLITILLVVTCFMIFLSIFIKSKFKKINIFVSILIFLILFISIFVFYYAINELASVSVGGFIGNGNLDITIPGEPTTQQVLCSWGPGLGFYVGLVSIGFIVLISIFKRYKTAKD